MDAHTGGGSIKGKSKGNSETGDRARAKSTEAEAKCKIHYYKLSNSVAKARENTAIRGREIHEGARYSIT